MMDRSDRESLDSHITGRWGEDSVPDDGDLCGETYDHKLRLIDTRDGISTYECTECGAETTGDSTQDELP